jgi:alanyl-tRNA synthetase
MTRKLYYTDSYTVEFEQKIIYQEKYDNFFAIKFDETYFYPTSGGQEHDVGSIDDIEIIDVIDENGDILHIVKKKVEGEIAHCKIDWKRRFDFMQQHTGQHILSESIQRVIGFGTVSSRLAEQSSTIDINTNSLDYQQVLKVEEQANQIIYDNIDVKIHFVNENDIKNFPLRKPPKFSGIIRVVEVDGFDFSACGGTHCRKTGEVGLIKIRKWEKIKGNMTRIEFFCGRRALYDYQWKNHFVVDLANSLTIKDIDLHEQIQKIIDDNKNLIKENDFLKSQLISFEAEELIKTAILEKNVRIVKNIFKDRPVNEVRLLAQKLIFFDNCIVLFGIINEQSNIIFARSSSLNQNMLQLFNAISHIIEAKGGGKPDFVQAGCKNPDKLQEGLEFAYRNLEI